MSCSIMRRYELYSENPIHLVRQSAKRRRVPHILHIDEIKRLLNSVASLPRLLIFLDVTTGLRQSELSGLRWSDLDFDNGEINVVRSVVHGVISRCKTESSAKPTPMDPLLADMLKEWRKVTPYRSDNDWGSRAREPKASARSGDRALCENRSIRPQRTRNHKANRMAPLPAFVFNFAPACGHRHQRAAGSVAAFIGAIDP